MGAWGEQQNVGVGLLLADGNAEFTEAVGLTMDGSGFGLGTRSRRYAAIIEDGLVTALFRRAWRRLVVSSADAVLAAL